MAEVTVIQYVLSRLKELGVTDVFGIPGDFAYPVCDAICDDAELRWIGCANEVNASYAADGYARRKGVGALVSTYGAGESYIFGGLAGAHSDSLKVVSLTGAPGSFERDGRKLHHQIADQPPIYDLFSEMVKPLTAGGDGVAIITPENCVYETERLIAAMLYHSKPINLAFPRDVPHQPIVMPEGDLDIPLADPKSDPDALDAVVREILDRVSNATRPCIVPGLAVRRHGAEAEALTLIEASGLPFFVGFSDIGVLSQSHPQYSGIYAGGWVGMAQPEITEFVEASDCLLALGPVNHEFNNAFHTMKYDFKSTINIMPHQTRVGMATFERAIISAVDGEIQPDAVGIVQWKLRWNGDDPSWLQDLPAASEARCPRDLFPNGACCLVDYPDGRQSEIHIFRTGFGRYTVRKLSLPSFGGLCRNPQFDRRADPESPTGREFVPCDQGRRS